jgi:hypothetical protein
MSLEMLGRGAETEGSMRRICEGRSRCDADDSAPRLWRPLLRANDDDGRVKRDGVGQAAARIRKPHGRTLASTTLPDVPAVGRRMGCKVPMDQGRGVVVGVDCPAVQMLGR